MCSEDDLAVTFVDGGRGCSRWSWGGALGPDPVQKRPQVRRRKAGLHLRVHVDAEDSGVDLAAGTSRGRRRLGVVSTHEAEGEPRRSTRSRASRPMGAGGERAPHPLLIRKQSSGGELCGEESGNTGAVAGRLAEAGSRRSGDLTVGEAVMELQTAAPWFLVRGKIEKGKGRL